MKRLKLDRDQSNDQPTVETVVVSKVTAASPSKAAGVISSLFKKSSFKKSIKPTPLSSSTSSSTNQENSAASSPNVRRITAQAVLQDCKDVKTNSPIKVNSSPARQTHGQKEAENGASQAKIKSFFGNTKTTGADQKENSSSQDCVVLD